MKWKFWEPEAEHRDYTSVLIEAFQQRAAGAATGLSEIQAYGQAAIEASSGWWARGFMSAGLNPNPGLGPAMLAEIGRGLIRRGESLWYIDLKPPGRRYRVVSSYEVRTYGGREYYQVTYSLPDRLNTRDYVPPGQVLHFRYAIDPVAPWRGIGPLVLAGQTVDLLARGESQLRAELSKANGVLLPQPSAPGSQDVQGLKESLKNLGGRTALVQTQRSSWGQPGGQNEADWRVTGLGADPASAAVELRQQVEHSVYAACGVPPGLLSGSSESSIRDSWRLFLAGTIRPFSHLVRDELRLKLGVPVEIELFELRAGDIGTTARAVHSLVQAGFSKEEAASLAGLA